MRTQEDISALAEQVVSRARVLGLRIATAESCTGGLVAAAITDVPGSSDVFDRGFVTYSNAAKIQMLGVDPEEMEYVGAVSEAVAMAMAIGALQVSGAGLAVAVTGIAGPGGGSEHKPVGLVHFAVAKALPSGTQLNSSIVPTRHREERFGDLGRANVRLQSVGVALELLLTGLSENV